MRAFIALTLLFTMTSAPVRAEEKKLLAREIDKQIFDVLKDVHNRGADMFNIGDAPGCYRMFQGSLLTAKALLAHRPAEQKFIDDIFAAADKEQTVIQRAFKLHESIWQLRDRLRDKTEPERIESLPREFKDDQPPKKKVEVENLKVAPTEFKEDKKEPVKPPFPPPDGVMGRLYWKGEPLPGVQVKFVLQGKEADAVEAKSDAAGRYRLEKVPPGKYTVVLTVPGGRTEVLPERYASPATSPLIVDVKEGGDTCDFTLQ